MEKNVLEQDAKLSRRGFVTAAGALGAMGALSALGCSPQSSTDATEADGTPASAEDEWNGVADQVTKEITVDVPGKPKDDGTYHVTFNGGPLASAEQHASIDSYDWRENRLSISQVAEDAKSMTDKEADEILFNEPEITQDYTTESGKVIPAVYIALRNRLLRVGQGVGAEVTDNSWDFLMQEFSEEEAAFYLKLPNFAYFTDEEAGEATGMSTEEAGAMCEDLSYRGLLNRVNRSGQKYYHVLAFAHGMLEFMMDRYEEDGFCDSVFGMCGSDYGYQSRNQGSTMYFPIPAQADIVGDTEILPNHDWNEIVDRYDALCVAPCQCRTFTPIRSGQKPGDWCDHPMETCIATGEQAEYYIENGIGRQIDKAEAREILQRGVDAGMVIEVMNTKECDVICQCHGDCCAILRGYISLEGDVENYHYMSQYELQVDHSKCIQCGSCAARCPLFTIEMTGEDGGPVIGNLCVRCGQCATVCPTGARKLFALPEKERFTMPEDMVDDYYRKGVERAKRGYINDFDPAKLQA